MDAQRTGDLSARLILIIAEPNVDHSRLLVLNEQVLGELDLEEGGRISVTISAALILESLMRFIPPRTCLSATIKTNSSKKDSGIIESGESH
jgi:hypothetical protein